jgi:type III pantothenate kinase
MLIAVDIGNSSINIGYFTGERLIVQRIETHPLKDADEYMFEIGNFLQQNRIEKNSLGGIISSVVPSHTTVLFEALRRLSYPEKEAVVTVSHKMHSGLKFKVDAPESVGTDRIANAVAASEFYGAPVAIVDFGTATTISVVGREGDFLGGSILPGLRLMSSALGTGTSQLREVVLEAPPRALGIDTAECIRSGLFYGTAGACERIIAEIEEETGFGLKLVLTGGYSQAVGGFLKRIHEIDLNLTLKGLKILYGKDRPS